MVGASRELLSSALANRHLSGDASTMIGAQIPPHFTMPSSEVETPTFHFDGRVEGIAYPSLSPVQQKQFKTDVYQEMASLSVWATKQNWSPSSPMPNLRIFVSDEYKISKALLPASVGQRGRIEFPAWKVVAGEAAIMHELVHVYFPNANRLLAEGLAVYLQAAIGGNSAFPNFGRSLHDLTRELLRKMLPEFAGGDARVLENIRLGDLDKIATPSPLRLRVGLTLYQDDPVGQAHIYPIAGAFVKFLIENEGIDKFRELFMLTPLKPFERDSGSPGRWSGVYGTSLRELDARWAWNLAEQSS
jgi:hypothetical protein